MSLLYLQKYISTYQNIQSSVPTRQAGRKLLLLLQRAALEELDDEFTAGCGCSEGG